MWRRTIQVKLSELKSRNDGSSNKKSLTESKDNKQHKSMSSQKSFLHGDTQIQIDSEQMEKDLSQNQAVVGFDDALIELQMQADKLSEAVMVNQNS